MQRCLAYHSLRRTSMELISRSSMSVLKVLAAVFLIIISTVCLPSAAGAHKFPRYMPALYVFGDSLADAGTNNYIPHCQFRANFTPYGVSFFPNATGRFTNGRTAFDFVATYLGLDFPPPFLQPNSNFSSGINFASAGSGLLDSTGAQANIIPFSYQISQFENYSQMLILEHGSEAAENLAKSLYSISIGGNDVGSYFLTMPHPSANDDFVALLINKTEEYLTRLYSAGARKFLLLDISALGCTPIARINGSQFYNGSCVKVANDMAKQYNEAQKAVVDKLNQQLEGLSIIQLDSFDHLLEIIRNGESYGFSGTKKACCGSGRFNADVACGKTVLYCKNPDAHVFWDGIHPTEHVYAIFAKEIWSGNSSRMHPFNLSTLVKSGMSDFHQ